MSKENENKEQTNQDSDLSQEDHPTNGNEADNGTSARDSTGSTKESVPDDSPASEKEESGTADKRTPEESPDSDSATTEGARQDESDKPEEATMQDEPAEKSQPDDTPVADEKTPDTVSNQSSEPEQEVTDTLEETSGRQEAGKDEARPSSEKKPVPEEATKSKDETGSESGPEDTVTEKPGKTDTEEKKKEKAGKGADGLHSEEDLKEKDDDDHDDNDDEVDYGEMSKEELVQVIKDLARSEEVIKAERVAREVKHAFDEIRDKEREEALKKFVKDGGEPADFAYRPDELTLRFDANYQLIRDRKVNHVKDKEARKESNLRQKEKILEQLREFVDSEETNISFDAFKTLQEQWKAVGPVPGAIARSLWANYNALVDRFYDKRSIYFELKELDRRKNLESKLELCERAEKLAEVTNINDAIKELNELHHEFKHIGPVPKDDQDPLWQRFKAASDAVYDRRKVFVEKLKSELEDNLRIKLEMAEKVKEFAAFDSDRIKAWNEKTRELLDIQKKWENTGGLPRARAKEVNRSFWSAFKQFFANKNQFFKKLDAEREENLEKKREMVERAKALKESDDWHDTAEKLKALQREWKSVGPVPGKFRESIYKEFKDACDTFFDRKRASQSDASKDYAENYKKKLAVCEKIEKLAKGDKNNLEEFRSLQEEYNETGFVPRNKISDIRNRYSAVVNDYVKALEGMTEEEKQRIKIENQVSDILHSPNADQKLYRKEQSLRKQISSIENDIALWKNNLEFFADSKQADKLKDEFQTKIESARDELKQLKQQLRIIRTA